MAESPLHQWGIFSLRDHPKGVAIGRGDLVVQVPDVWNSRGMQMFIHHWEGKQVSSVVPGMGMLANGGLSQKANVLAHTPNQDDADCPRETCPAAGSFTHYHNYTWYVSKTISAGQELLVNYGKEWFEERDLLDDQDDDDEVPQYSVDHLRQHGLCLDNLRPTRHASSLPQAGRGAVAARRLPQHSVVAPLVLLPIFDWQTSLTLVKVKTSPQKRNSLEQTQQLLLNYCLGHKDSSVVWFPYSPMVNLINHSRDKPNVRMQWSQKYAGRNQKWLQHDLDYLEENMDPDSGTSVLMELVALRDISPGEEILLDYGPEWQEAFEEHLANWKPAPEGTPPYTPGHILDHAVAKLRTQAEQASYPYADNVITSCFFEIPETATPVSDETGITTVLWKWTRHVFEYQNQYPCIILTRPNDAYYTVQLRNRKSAPQRLPFSPYIVSKVPRNAIRFSDKYYTTDQHLSGAFRHWIGIPDDIFPTKWRDEAVQPRKQHEPEGEDRDEL
jgi:hypothetical protein